MNKELIYHPLFIFLLIVLSFMLLVCLIRAVRSEERRVGKECRL